MQDEFQTPEELREQDCLTKLRGVPGVRIEGKTIRVPMLHSGLAPIQFLVRYCRYKLVTE